MATLTIPDLPDVMRDRLRSRAAENGRSIEEEARELLMQACPPLRLRLTDEEWLKQARHVQELVAGLIPPGASLADDLIGDRRWEAACEAASANSLPMPPRSDFD